MNRWPTKWSAQILDKCFCFGKKRGRVHTPCARGERLYPVRERCASIPRAREVHVYTPHGAIVFHKINNSYMDHLISLNDRWVVQHPAMLCIFILFICLEKWCKVSLEQTEKLLFLCAAYLFSTINIKKIVCVRAGSEKSFGRCCSVIPFVS